MRGISWLAENLLASQEALCSMVWVSEWLSKRTTSQRSVTSSYYTHTHTHTHTQINITSPLNTKISTCCIQISILSPLPYTGNIILSLVYIRPSPATFSRPDIQSVSEEIQTKGKVCQSRQDKLRRIFFWLAHCNKGQPKATQKQTCSVTGPSLICFLDVRTHNSSHYVKTITSRDNSTGSA